MVRARKKLTRLLMVKGNLKQAKVYTEDILKAQPDDIDGRYYLGQVNLAEGDYQGAIQQLSSVTRDSPRFPQGFYYLGIAQLRTNQPQLAKRSLAKPQN